MGLGHGNGSTVAAHGDGNLLRQMASGTAGTAGMKNTEPTHSQTFLISVTQSWKKVMVIKAWVK